MKLWHVLCLIVISIALVAMASGGERASTTLATPPWTHCLGLHKVTQFHLDVYSGYREKFNGPEGLFCTKLASENKPDTPRDDDELTVYGLNTGNCDLIYNKSLTSIGIVGGRGAGVMRFRDPQSLTGDSEGNVFVADTGNDRIAHLRYEANDDLTWVREIRIPGDEPLSAPSGIVASGGLLYVADTGNDRIAVLRPDGTLVKTLRPECRGAALSGPYAIAAVTEGDDWIYYADHFLAVTDSLRQRLWRISPDGKAASLVRRSALVGKGSFDHVAIDYYGNIYATDRAAGLIHKFDRHLRYIVAIGEEKSGDRMFDEPRGITIYRRFGQVFVSERSGAQYFWIGTDILRFSADNLVIDATRKRCSIEVSFLLTECSNISLVLRGENGKILFTMLPDYILPAGKFVRTIDVDCPPAAALTGSRMSLVISAKPTYSSRSYLSVERESRLLLPRVPLATSDAPR